MTAVDRVTPVPPYVTEIRTPLPGRHRRATTRAARRSDPRRWGRLHDLITHLAAERAELRRTGQPLTTRSAA